MVFGFVFVIIVIGFLLTGGFKFIQGIFGASESAVQKKNIEDFKRAVEDIFWTTSDSRETFEIKVVGGIDKVCFLDPSNPENNPGGGWSTDEDIRELIKDKGYNMVLLDQEGGLKGHIIEKLSPDENFCVGTTTELLLINRGKRVHAEVNR